MTSLNPLHTTLQNFYNQLSNQVLSNKPGQPEADVAQRLGVPAGLVQDLRNDVKAVIDGHDPEKAVANLLKGLQKLQAFVSPQGLRGNADAKERPAGLEPSRDGIDFVMGKDGHPEQVRMAKERPAGVEPSHDGIDFVMGKDGQPKQVNMTKERPAGLEPSRDGIDFVMGKDGHPEQVKMAKERPAGVEPSHDGIDFVMGKDGHPEQVKMAKERPAGVELSLDGINFVMGKDGHPEQVNMAKERPAGQEPSSDGIGFVMGEDGQPKQISSTEAQYLDSQSSGSVQAKSDKVVLSLKQFLEAGATGNNAEQALEGLREAMQNLFDDVANNPDQVRKALMNSIRSQA